MKTITHRYHLRLPLIALLTALTFAACRTTKDITSDHQNPTSNTQHPSGDLNFLRKVNDNAVYSRHINAKVDLTVDGKSLPVSTQLQTTQGRMVRLSLTALGLMEVGRMEFTPQDVLIVDRVHKQFARADYGKVKFMAKNGLTFYTLEALIRNQLFLPQHTNVGEDQLRQYDVTTPTQHPTPTTTVAFHDTRMDYAWQTDSKTGLIQQATITYHDSKQGESTVQWTYSDFTNLAKKQYPTTHTIRVTLADKPGRQRTMQLKLKKIDTTTDNSAPTTVSAKYAEVDIDELFQSIMNQ